MKNEPVQREERFLMLRIQSYSGWDGTSGGLLSNLLLVAGSGRRSEQGAQALSHRVLKVVTAPGMLMHCFCCPLVPIFITPHTD